MSFYLDTSVVMTGLFTEPGTPKVQSWFAEREDARFMVSSWLTVEFSSAIARRVRMGELDPVIRPVLLEGLARVLEMWVVIPVDHGHFLDAARLIDQATVALRSGDALHLAVARRQNARLVTRDIGFRTAADSLGHPAILL